MRKVLLRFYDKDNLGDDLFVKIITERYKNNFTAIVTRKNRFLESITNLKIHRNVLFFPFLKMIEKLSGIRNIWLRLLQRKSDLLVYIGGSLFIENNRMQMWKKEEQFYLDLKVPYYILGSNFGPYEHPEFIDTVKTIFKNSKDTCFRDEASYRLFEELSTTRVATDIAFSLDTSAYSVKKEKIAIISMIDCKKRFGDSISEKYNLEMQELTKRLVNMSYKVVYMPFCGYEGDKIASEAIMSQLDTGIKNSIEVFNYDGNLEEALSLIAKSEIIVGTRFHAVILGLLFGKKVLPFAYSDKTINILKDMDFKGKVVDIRDMEDFDGSTFDFNSLQVNDVSEQIKLAELQFQELDKVLVKK